MGRKTFTAEFKRQAVAMSQSPGATVQGVCSEFGISETALRRWIHQYREQGERAFPGQGNALLTPEQAEILRLRKENEQLKEERAILKKAAAFFARESR